MTVLILAEHAEGRIKPATLSAVTAAKALGGDITLLVLGDDVAATSMDAACIDGVQHVITGQNIAFADHLAEAISAAVLEIAGNYNFILAAATASGKNVLPRIAAKLDVQQISDVIAVLSPTRFVRPIYAGNALQTVETAQPRNILTIRATGFAPAIVGKEAVSDITSREFTSAPLRVRFVAREVAANLRPELTSAKIVVAGGRGVGSRENFRIIEELADDLGAAVGASRAAVDAGYVPNDYQVGQTGKIVAPELYVAIGISGAIQHLAGMTGAKTVVAINKDADAPIFQVADYGLVGDLFEILPLLRDELKR